MKKSTQQKVKIQSVSKSNIYQSNEAKQKQNKGKFSPEDLIKNRKQRKFIVKPVSYTHLTLPTKLAV
ncbi:hypothetical protein KQJ29_24830, partial [Enterococcus sp. S181_ASV_20]|nr:hypothetical protein [Enterococcus sp. S181_ASV_20]